MPVDDQWYLPALKLQWDLGKSQIISNTSYYHRKELTGYQGTVYDLGFFQLLGWPSNPLFGGLGCLRRHATGLPVVPADRRQRHSPAGRLHQLPDAKHDNQPPAELRAGAALAVDRRHLALALDRGRLLAAGEGGQHRESQRSHRPDRQLLHLPVRRHRHRSVRALLLVPDQCQLPVHSGLQHLLQQQYDLRPADRRLRRSEFQLHRPAAPHPRRARRAHHLRDPQLRRRPRELRPDRARCQRRRHSAGAARRLDHL